MINQIIVQTLIGRKQLDFYLNCIESFLDHCEENVSVNFHTDGTISSQQKDYIKNQFSDSKISISNDVKSKSKTLDALYGRPNCQKFRQDSIWGVEFFDPIFAFPEDQISFYIDADILFLRSFSGLFDRNEVRGGAIFLNDTQWDAYCFRPWQMLTGKSKLQSVKGITTGLVFWDKAVIDWDYLEWFLGENHLHKIPEWIMPTAQAGLAHRCEAKTISPRHLPNLYPNAQIHEDTIGVHLLGSYRKHWMEKLVAREKNHAESSLTITPSFERCKRQNFFGYSLRQFRRWKNTRLNIW